jgi:hypothetical protein
MYDKKHYYIMVLYYGVGVMKVTKFLIAKEGPSNK